MVHMDVSENSGTPKSSILIGFSIINHPFWGTPIFGNTHINLSSLRVGSQTSTVEKIASNSPVLLGYGPGKLYGAKRTDLGNFPAFPFVGGKNLYFFLSAEVYRYMNGGLFFICIYIYIYNIYIYKLYIYILYIEMEGYFVGRYIGASLRNGESWQVHDILVDIQDLLILSLTWSRMASMSAKDFDSSLVYNSVF